MAKLLINRVEEPKPWTGNYGPMYGFFVHGLLDGAEATGKMNVKELKNIPAVGSTIEVSVQETEYGLKFNKINTDNGYSRGPSTPQRVGQTTVYDGISDLIEKRPMLQPVDVNAAIARAIEFVKMSPDLATDAEAWSKVEVYARNIVELQQAILKENA